MRAGGADGEQVVALPHQQGRLAIDLAPHDGPVRQFGERDTLPEIRLAGFTHAILPRKGRTMPAMADVFADAPAIPAIWFLPASGATHIGLLAKLMMRSRWRSGAWLTPPGSRTTPSR